MHRRTDKISRRWFSLGLAAAPITAALGVGSLVPQAQADEPAESSKDASRRPIRLD